MRDLQAEVWRARGDEGVLALDCDAVLLLANADLNGEGLQDLILERLEVLCEDDHLDARLLADVVVAVDRLELVLVDLLRQLFSLLVQVLEELLRQPNLLLQVRLGLEVDGHEVGDEHLIVQARRNPLEQLVRDEAIELRT